VVRTYRDIVKTIRILFLHFSTEGINDPEKAFRLSRTQFVKLLKETGLDQHLRATSIDIIFIQCNSNDFAQVGKAESEDDAADEAQDRTLDLDEFVEAMIRVAKEVDIPEIQNARDVADKLDKLHSSQLEPLLLPTHPGGPCEPTKLLQLDEEEKTFLQTQLDAAKPKLLKMFKFYAGGDKDVSCLEFLRFAKECGLRELTISFTKCIAVFIDSNQHEVDLFFAGNISSEHLADNMAMDFPEFVQVKFHACLPLLRRQIPCASF